MTLALDHLVIAARTLGEGLAWCEATLGLRPEAGGRHAGAAVGHFAINGNQHLLLVLAMPGVRDAR